MKLAVVGKGGCGKTVLVSLLARAISERGLMVLAVDLDASPGLALSLGVPPVDLPLPDEAVEQRSAAAYGWGLAGHLSAAEAVRRFATPVSERVRFIGFGSHASVHTPVARFITAVREIAEGFSEPGWVVVADMAAGPSTPFAGDARFATLALVAAEALPVSLLTARRLLNLLREDGTPAEMVVTKADDSAPGQLEAHAEGVRPLAAIPFDPEVRRLEREGPLCGLAADSAALEATRALVTKLGL